MCAHLKKHASLSVWNRTPRDMPRGVVAALLEEVASKPVVIIGTTVGAQEALLKQIAPHVQPGALVLDVTSVEVKPVELMSHYLPKHCHILATHPLFGPESGKDGIAELKIVLHPVRIPDDRYARVKEFVTNQLKLVITEMSPEEHDQEMAYVQGLTFFIGEALKAINIPNEDLSTATYRHLLEIKSMSDRHTTDLFATIEHDNPYAQAARETFLTELQRIQGELDLQK